MVGNIGAGAVIVMDNAHFHSPHVLAAAAAAVGCFVKYVPSYSPELNAIELMIGWVKMDVMRNWQVVRPNLYQEVLKTVAAVPPAHAGRWVRRCGYQ